MSKHEKQKSSAAAMSEGLGLDAEKMEEARLLEHPSYIELQNKLTEAEAKATQNWERVLRNQAEMDNLHRRVERDIANAHKYSLEKFVGELLPIVDTLERATDHTEDEGIILTKQMLMGVLEKFGVEQVNPLDQPFNPELHQAVSTQEDPNKKPGTVLNVMQKGYLLNGRLVRPALVIVSK